MLNLRRLVIVSAALLLAFTIAPGLNGQAVPDVVVCPTSMNGCDYTDIQAAIDAAAPGWTIEVRPGTYVLTDTLLVDESVALVGPQMGVDPRPSAGSLRSASDAASEAILVGPAKPDEKNKIMAIVADSVVVDGFTFSGFKNSDAAKAAAVSGVVLRNNMMVPGGGDGSLGVSVNFDDCDGCTLQANHLDGAHRRAFYISSASEGTTIADNEIVGHNYHYAAIEVCGPDATVTGNLVRDSVAYDAYPAMAAIAVGSGDHRCTGVDGTYLISGNTVIGNSGAGGIDVATNVQSCFDPATTTVAISNNIIGPNAAGTGIRIGPLTAPGIPAAADCALDIAASVLVNGNDIAGNPDGGVANGQTFGSFVDATGNYWGSNDGPSGVGPGSGDAVTDRVDYGGFTTAPIIEGPVRILGGAYHCLTSSEFYTNIPQAIGCANAGATIVVDPGDYRASFVIPTGLDGLTLCQANEDQDACADPLAAGFNPAAVQVLPDPEGHPGIIVVKSDDVTIQGLGVTDDLVGHTTHSHHLVALQADRGTYSHGTIQGRGATCDSSIQDVGVMIRGFNSVGDEIGADNTVHAAHLSGLCWGITATKSPISDTNNDPATGTVVTDTVLDDIAGSGILVNGASGLTATGNTFSNSGAGVFFDKVSTQAWTVTDNTFAGNGWNLRLYGTTANNDVDARYNDWGAYDCVAINALIQDGGTDNAVAISPWRMSSAPGAALEGCVRLSSGAWYDTIQQAIDAALPGDAVLLWTGHSYAESVSIATPGITLCQGDATMTACGSDPADTVIDASGQASPLIDIAADGVTLEGFTLLHAGAATQAIVGIDFSGTDGTTLDNLIISLEGGGCGPSVIVQGSCYLPYPITGAIGASTTNALVQDTLFSASLLGDDSTLGGTNGLILGGAGGAVTNSHFEYWVSNGLFLTGTGTSADGNSFDINSSGLLVCDGGSDAAITNNLFGLSQDAVALCGGADETVINENFMDRPHVGLSLRAAGLDVDARFNHWGAFRNDTIHASRIQGDSADVDVGCFYDLDGVTPVCPPVVDFSFLQVAQVDWPKTVTFADQSTFSDTNRMSRLWTFHDGTTSSESNPKDTYYAPGLYPVRLAVSDDRGYVISETKTIPILQDNYRFELTPLFQVQQDVSPGQTLAFDVRVDNLGVLGDTYGITVANAAGWAWSHPASVSLASGGSQVVSFSAVVPANSGESAPSFVVTSGGNQDSEAVLVDLAVRPTIVVTLASTTVYEGDELAGKIRLTFPDGSPVANQAVSLEARHALFSDAGLGALATVVEDHVTDANGFVRFEITRVEAAGSPLYGLRGQHVLTISADYFGSLYEQSLSYTVRPVVSL